ncbi:MAG: DNA translocase FtsK [Dehalococcoidia bacterium]|nr:DNA translocase FtsK [Dehalococcoidia bacterium]
MPVKTRPRPRHRGVSYRPRKTTAARRAPRSSGGPSLPAAQPVFIATGFAGAVALALAVVFLGPIINAFEAVLRVFGLGLVALTGAVALDAWLFSRKPELDSRSLRTWCGAHLLLLFGFGLAGLLKPGWTAGDVSFSEVSAGGNLGRLFTGSAAGVLGWLAAGATGFSLVWPRRAGQAWQGAAAAGRWTASLEIPQRAWQAISALFTGLLPRAEAEREKLLDRPYLPQWDEEWQETPDLEPELEPEPAADGTAEVSDVIVTSEPAEEAGAFQRALPMGRPAGHGWELPPLDLLAEAADVEVRPVDNEARSKLIIDTLASFGVDARVVSIAQGPTVTQFGVEPGWETKTRSVGVRDESGRPIYDREGRPVTRTEVVSRTRVRVNRVTALANDLALALAAPTIRIEAPVPGKPIIGIEVPNSTASLVALRSVIESTAFQKANLRSKLALALGKGVSGEPVASDLSRMPHLLIAGATGSGKSVCINSIIACFLLHNTPEDLRLVLVDPKRVELATFASIPHLAFSKIITDPDDVVGTLQAVIHEMDSRYRRFATAGVRNIEAYNKSPRATYTLPYWVVIIDELADLMMASPYEVERQICRLAQLSRATGIHLIIATQRPSVDVVTGLIKANFPTRIAFAVSSQVDSRTIIDGGGAEKLLGRGDMLFMPTDASKPKRIQGCYVSDADIDRVVAWWANDKFRHLVPDKMDHLLAEVEDEEAQKAAEEDPLYEAAKELAMQHSRVSTSLLQRRLHIGYPRAARLIDILEDAGVISSAEGGHSRVVLARDGEDAGDGDRFE